MEKGAQNHHNDHCCTCTCNSPTSSSNRLALGALAFGVLALVFLGGRSANMSVSSWKISSEPGTVDEGVAVTAGGVTWTGGTIGQGQHSIGSK